MDIEIFKNKMKAILPKSFEEYKNSDDKTKAAIESICS
jgi:hypothetical protein